MSDRLTVLTSKSVFTGTGDLPFEGFVAVRGNRIEAVGTKCEVASYLTQADEVVDLRPHRHAWSDRCTYLLYRLGAADVGV